MLVWFAVAPTLLCSLHYKDSQENLEVCEMQYCSQEGLLCVCVCVCVWEGGINVGSNACYCCYFMTSPGFVLSQPRSQANPQT